MIDTTITPTDVSWRGFRHRVQAKRVNDTWTVTVDPPEPDLEKEVLADVERTGHVNVTDSGGRRFLSSDARRGE